MAAEWVQVHKRSWAYLVFVTLYGGLVEAFFGLIGLVGVVMLIGNLLRFAGLHVMSGELDMHLSRDLMRGSTKDRALSILLLIGETGLAGLFAWWGLRGALACLIDAVFPAAIYQGRLEDLSVRVESSKNGTSSRYWMLTAGGKTWQIPCRATDRWSFEKEVTPGKEIRARYLRGSEQVTRLWVKAAMSD